MLLLIIITTLVLRPLAAFLRKRFRVKHLSYTKSRQFA